MSIEPVVGDILILAADDRSHVYAIGAATTYGQRAWFGACPHVKANGQVMAVGIARGMVLADGPILIRGVDRWSELSSLK